MLMVCIFSPDCCQPNRELRVKFVATATCRCMCALRAYASSTPFQSKSFFVHSFWSVYRETLFHHGHSSFLQMFVASRNVRRILQTNHAYGGALRLVGHRQSSLFRSQQTECKLSFQMRTMAQCKCELLSQAHNRNNVILDKWATTTTRQRRRKTRKKIGFVMLCARHFFLRHFVFCFIRTQPVRLFPFHLLPNSNIVSHFGLHTHSRAQTPKPSKKKNSKKWSVKIVLFRMAHNTGEWRYRFRTHCMRPLGLCVGSVGRVCVRASHNRYVVHTVPDGIRIDLNSFVLCARVCESEMRVWWQQRHSTQYSFSVGVCLQAKQVLKKREVCSHLRSTFCVIFFQNNLFNLIFKRRKKQKQI